VLAFILGGHVVGRRSAKKGSSKIVSLDRDLFLLPVLLVLFLHSGTRSGTQACFCFWNWKKAQKEKQEARAGRGVVYVSSYFVFFFSSSLLLLLLLF